MLSWVRVGLGGRWGGWGWGSKLPRIVEAGGVVEFPNPSGQFPNTTVEFPASSFLYSRLV